MKKMLPLCLLLGAALLLACTGTKTPEATDEDVVCGGFGRSHPLTAEDSLVFATALRDSTSLRLMPREVSMQVVAGMNYRFVCDQANTDGTTTQVEVSVFAPLPGEGEPRVTGIYPVGR